MQGMQSGRCHRAARFVLLSCALASLAFALASPAPTPAAAASGSLSMSSGAASLALGDSTAVTLDLSGAVDVHEVDLYVLYNPGVVRVIDADAATTGTQILPGPFPGQGGSVTANSAAGGSIEYRFVLPSSVTASGSGTVATVRFQAVGPGDAGLGWGAVQLVDGASNATTPPATAVQLTVGDTTIAATGTAAATDTPLATGTPSATGTPAPTTTAAATSTAAGTPSGTSTARPTASTTATRTPTVTGTPPATITPRATASPRITVLQNSNQPTQTIDQKLGVDGASQQNQALPSAGNGGPGTQWWRWTFFGAALMLGVAGWFFTFALHASDRDVVLLDRHDRRRRRP
ncbi:MAG: hypothetical protein IVW36_10925 [Dehalococcoidia bacterium]|nr:hypothetical protein [Dehalococcoidia bacterium]